MSKILYNRAVKSWKELIRFLKIEKSLAESKLKTEDAKGKNRDDSDFYYAMGYKDAMKSVLKYINESE